MKRISLIITTFLLSLCINAQSILKEGYQLIPTYGGNLIGFKYNGKIGFISNSSDCFIMIDPQFDDIYVENYNLSDNMILVSINGKWGAIDGSFETPLSLQPIIPCKYDKIEPFRNGKAKVILKGKTFYINKKGEKL